MKRDVCMCSTHLRQVNAEPHCHRWYLSAPHVFIFLYMARRLSHTALSWDSRSSPSTGGAYGGGGGADAEDTPAHAPERYNNVAHIYKLKETASSLSKEGKHSQRDEEAGK